MSTTNTTNGNTPDPWQIKELGVFWKRTKNGTNESYLTGTINLKKLADQGVDIASDIQVIMFTNKRKQKDTHPDLRMYVSEKRNTSDAPAPTPAKTAPAPAKKAPVKAAAPADDLI